MKTRAAVLYRPGEAMRVEEVELDPPKDHEVQVLIVAAGICHSDYHIVAGDLPAYLPMAIGHEGAGIVEEVGANVTNCKPGDHVVLSFIPSCGTCRYCTSGHANLCNMGAAILAGPQLDGTFRMRNEQGGIGQMCVISTFSERTVVPDMSVVVIEDHYPLNRAVLVGCGVPTGVGAVTHRAKVVPGSSVMVIGCGGIGSKHFQGAGLLRAGLSFYLNIKKFKLEKKKQLVGHHTKKSRQQE